MAEVKVDSRYIEGIMFNDTKATIPLSKDKEGRRKVIYEKISRKLLSSDILSFKDYDTEVVFVTADGRKYVRPKLGKAGG